MMHLLRLRVKKSRVLDALATLVAPEVICQVYAETLSTVHHFQHVSMEPVVGLSLKASVNVYYDDLTLLWVKLHLPFCHSSSASRSS